MSKHVIKTPDARRDLLDQAAFIAENSLEAAERFLDAAEATCELLAGMPLMGGMCNFQHPQTVGLRVWQIQGFKNHLIFYRPTDEGIDVVRVIHAARDIQGIFSDTLE